MTWRRDQPAYLRRASQQVVLGLTEEFWPGQDPTSRTPRVFTSRPNSGGVLHADPFIVALVFLVAGVVGSVLPLVPGGLLSTVGVLYYWRATGDPSTVVLVLLVSLGLLVIVVDWFGGAVAARFGGASPGTTAAAVVAGLGLALVLGPLGLVAGIFAVVFGLEYRRHGEVERGARTAASATAGILVSTVMQVLLTVLMLAVFLVAP